MQELVEYISKDVVSNEEEAPASESEIEVDYEENSSSEVISKAPLMRQLREYSPERRSEPTQKKPCTNFSKNGICRFGDECRYAHIAPQPRRRNVSSRVKLMNLSSSEAHPEALSRIMSSYGSVISATVYPEKGEAVVQFATGEEASKAVEGAVNDFESEGVVIELETTRPATNVFRQNINRTLKSNPPVVHQHHPEPKDEKLRSLLALQKQQQTLLETNLSTQRSLLSHLQSPSKNAAERAELIASLGKIQESVMGVQEMLKRTTELVIEAAGKQQVHHSHQSHQSHSHQSYNHQGHSHQGHNHQIYNQGHNQSYSHQNNYNQGHGHQRPLPFRPKPVNHKFGNSTFVPGRPASHSHNPSTSYNKTYVPGRPQSTTSTSHSLDLRPTTLKLSSLKSTPLGNIHDLQRHFSPYGPIQSLIIMDNGEAALIKYQKHGDAQKALEKSGKEGEMDIEFIKP